MDKPSMGLSPAYVEQVVDIIRTISRQGVTIFMVEQKANVAFQVAHRAYILQTGQIVLTGPAAELRETELIRHAYLGELKVA
jgi:branched-chain amino acid transport system ATP-binding protein